eukprot:6350715-Ditylum_brightwellii.AAC.1
MFQGPSQPCHFSRQHISFSRGDPVAHAVTMETGKANKTKQKNELCMQVLTTLQLDYTADCICSVERGCKCMNRWINVALSTANNGSWDAM